MKLTQKQQVIKLREQGKNFAQIGKVVGVSRQRVGRIIEKLKNKCEYCGDHCSSPLRYVFYPAKNTARQIQVCHGCYLLLVENSY